MGYVYVIGTIKCSEGAAESLWETRGGVYCVATGDHTILI